MKESVAVVVVLYKAEMSVCHQRLLADGKVTLIVVDNTPDRDLALKGNRLVYLPLRKNLGIATAQNEGIRQALWLRCDYVIFFDQDSMFPLTYIQEITKEYRRIKRFYPIWQF